MWLSTHFCTTPQLILAILVLLFATEADSYTCQCNGGSCAKSNISGSNCGEGPNLIPGVNSTIQEYTYEKNTPGTICLSVMFTILSNDSARNPIEAMRDEYGCTSWDDIKTYQSTLLAQDLMYQSCAPITNQTRLDAFWPPYKGRLTNGSICACSRPFCNTLYKTEQFLSNPTSSTNCKRCAYSKNGGRVYCDDKPQNCMSDQDACFTIEDTSTSPPTVVKGCVEAANIPAYGSIGQCVQSQNFRGWTSRNWTNTLSAGATTCLCKGNLCNGDTRLTAMQGGAFFLILLPFTSIFLLLN